MNKELFYAIWTFIGVVIGAGIFGLPYVFIKAGFFTGLVVLLVAATISLIVALYLGEIVLRTKGKHQLTGLAEKYLGKKGKYFMFIANFLSIYGALAAYIIGSGQILNSIFGGNVLLFNLLFFIVVSPVIYFSINSLERFQNVFTPLKIILVVVLSLLLITFVDFNNFTGFSLTNILLPYGVAIFAFTGFSAIPEMNEELKNKKNLFWAILFGMIISLVVNLLFIFAVVGADSDVNQVATTSLNNFGFGIGLFANLFALFAMATAFVGLGFALKENLTLDLKLGNKISFLLVVLVPLILVLTNFFNFVELLELAGAVAIGLILLLILVMHSKAKKLGNRKPEYSLRNLIVFKIFLAVILILGIIYSIKGVI